MAKIVSSGIDDGVRRLEKGEVVGFPTETVYGLAGSILSEVGIRKIFSTKKRPFFDPLIVHVSSKKMAEQLTTDWNPLADFLAEHFWPGPLTLVLPKSDLVSDLITSGLQTVGIRMPKHTLALSLIDRLGSALAAPSANRFGKTSPTSAQHVAFEFPDDDFLIFDGGPCEVGLESTVLSIKRIADNYELSILRAGHVTKSDLEKATAYLKFKIKFVETLDRRESPGQMKHHYMPQKPLVLVRNSNLSENQILEMVRAKIKDLPDEVEQVQIVKPTQIVKISEMKLPESAELAARSLYSELRNLANLQSDLIYFRLKPEFEKENWQATIDRLTKAASLILD